MTACYGPRQEAESKWEVGPETVGAVVRALRPDEDEIVQARHSLQLKCCPQQLKYEGVLRFTGVGISDVALRGICRYPC